MNTWKKRAGSLLSVVVSLGAFLWASVEVYLLTGRAGLLTILGYALSIGIVFFIPILFTAPQSASRDRLHIGGTVMMTAIFAGLGNGIIRVGILCTGTFITAMLALYRRRREPSTVNERIGC